MRTCYIIRDVRAIADLSQSDDGTWQIHRINVPQEHRGTGRGRTLLREILQDADAENVTLWLLPSPSGGLEYSDLVKWYRRYGFEWQDVPDRSILIRKPNRANVQNSSR